MSGIYIKGMEMPKHGTVIIIYANGIVTDYDDEHQEALGTAIPVPEHGRLGDLDVLREAVGKVELEAREEYYNLSDAEKECEYEMGVWDGIHMAAKILSTAPTIIPASEGDE